MLSPLAPPPSGLLRGAALFLDFDGTLVEIIDHPGQVQVDAGLRTLLAGLAAALEGRLAIVSGRSAAQMAALLHGLPLLIGASHGAELRWADGRTLSPAIPIAFTAAQEAQLTALAASHSGVLLERKPFGMAIHYRMAPEAEAQCVALAGKLAKQTGLALQTGKQVIELREPGANKGQAVRAFLAEPPMAGRRPIFIGDDDTDEAGFATARLLSGDGIRIGSPRPSAAGFVLPSVTANRRWLDAERERLT
jgi:trehalose 6-phosphate phosphatase